jgi:hypothetical protein
MLFSRILVEGDKFEGRWWQEVKNTKSTTCGLTERFVEMPALLERERGI